MAKFITRFPLSHFDELVPLLMRCFPDFWEPRLKRGMRSFPYDLKLFTAKIGGRLIGTVGIHDYQFLLDGTVIPCGGLSDVGVDPDFRGRGYAGKLQDFAWEYCQKNYYCCPMMPLYTDKPGVYLSRGWQLYEPDRSREIRTEDFPKRNTFRIDTAKLRREYLRLKSPPKTREEQIVHLIWCIYQSGQEFSGKCMRSEKTWLELFAEPEHEWRLEIDTYFLYRKDRLLEAYSADPGHPVCGFVPVQGGHNDNKLMIRLADSPDPLTVKIAAAVKNRTLLFPIADTF